MLVKASARADRWHIVKEYDPKDMTTFCGKRLPILGQAIITNQTDRVNLSDADICRYCSLWSTLPANA